MNWPLQWARPWALACLSLVAAVGAEAAPVLARVVDMLPSGCNHLTAFAFREPSLAIDPSNPKRMASIWLMDGTLSKTQICHYGGAPYLWSTDTGDSWTFACVGSQPSSDATLAFGSGGGPLYVAELHENGKTGFQAAHDVSIFRNGSLGGYNNWYNVKTVKTYPGFFGFMYDQPFIEASSVTQPKASKATDLVALAMNDVTRLVSQTGTAIVSHSSDGQKSKPAFTDVLLDHNSSNLFDRAQVRTAIHSSGVTYAVFLRQLGEADALDTKKSKIAFDCAVGKTTNNISTQQKPLKLITLDLVVVRKDNTASTFNSLNGTAGTAIASSYGMVSAHESGCMPTAMGYQRISPQVAIAVDPSDDQHVFVAWSEATNLTDLTLKLSESTDGGANWNAVTLTRAPSGAINPALAVNSNGSVALLFQEFHYNSGNQPRWESWIWLRSGGSEYNLKIADAEGLNPPPRFNPYLGDYGQLLARGKTFYGVFSINIKDAFQHLGNNTKVVLPGGNSKVPSVSPVFFEVTD